ncbi:vitamin B12 ABC transporter ATP-binding protein BtuD [Kluyvera cryocrescens]|uniref:Vitamin B12 import ATP-binding protein BtuD n=1 Tax=Kluyvera cryocrescens TaxID=580 RepID=A0A485BRK9_KLUCR|nr:vitamin B12 ABC transporter ATP-binding protein BtuD [Kluyvera cryocrescens]VFS74896.1 Vitamin B12 import ATP-binding protein BtuD [Kluyvera cryocrescens]
MMPLMQLQDVGENARLRDVSVDVARGEMIHLVGPNGAGKSTLLARMAGLSRGKGMVRLNGQPLDTWTSSALARHRAYLSQHQTPPFAMPVWQFLMLHQHNTQHSPFAVHVTEALGLSNKLGRNVSQLSGGEWQRVRLAAVILQVSPWDNADGQLLLLDEPMNSLDVAQQAALDKLLAELCAAGVTIIMSSHDLNYTLRHANQVWLLCAGRLIASGKTDAVLQPENLATAYNMTFQKLEIAGHQWLVYDDVGEK